MPQPFADPDKFALIHQVGGIRTARYDWPDAGGAPGCRVAVFDTGTPLRFVLNLDRGGDVVEASYGGLSLAWLTPNGYAPPSHELSRAERWSVGWNGGLVSTCGPDVIGRKLDEAGRVVDLHGAFHHRPAAVTAIRQPDPRDGVLEMGVDLVVRVAQLFGPIYEIRRTVSATLGVPGLRVRDTVRNAGNTAVDHHWLYHVNLGYPLLDEGAELVLGGTAACVWGDEPGAATHPEWKRVNAPTPDHAGDGERGVTLTPPAGTEGHSTVGLINPALGVGVRLRYDAATLPRLANWQHYGPAGSYVAALEPFNGQLLPTVMDPVSAHRALEPGEQREYAMDIDVLIDADALAALRRVDGPVELAE